MHSPKVPKAPDPRVVSQAQTQSNQQTAQYNAALAHGNTTTPYGSQSYTTRIDPATGATVYDQTVSLDPRAQSQFDAQMDQNTQLIGTQNDALARVRDAYSQPMNTSGVPQLQGQIDMTDMPALYGATDLEAARKQVQDANYNRQAGYLDPQWQQREAAFRTRMNNQGVVEGSEAWRNALDDENRARTFDYDQARSGAIAAGGDEMSRLAQIAAANRGQTYNERSNNAGFANNARTQGLQELYTQRAQPLAEFNSLRSSAPIEMPQFQNPENPTVAPTNVSGNIWNAYQGDLDAYNAAQAGRNSLFGGLIGAAGQMGSAWITSDERVKSDITQVGQLPDGTNIYDYYKGGVRERGVLAQEVEKTNPRAVKTGNDGIKRVNYRRVMARAMEAA